MAKIRRSERDILAQHAAYLSAEHGTSQTQIGKLLGGVSQAVVSRLIKHAEREGWLERRLIFHEEKLPKDRLEALRRLAVPPRLFEALKALGAGSGVLHPQPAHRRYRQVEGQHAGHRSPPPPLRPLRGAARVLPDPALGGVRRHVGIDGRPRHRRPREPDAGDGASATRRVRPRVRRADRRSRRTGTPRRVWPCGCSRSRDSTGPSIRTPSLSGVPALIPRKFRAPR